MTGTVAYAAISASFSERSVRSMIASTYRDSTRAVSAMVSPRPSWVSRPDSTITSPPSCRTPTSKLTRVRVLGCSNSRAMVRPASGCCGLPCLKLRPRSSMWRNVAGSKSRNSRKCRGGAEC